MSEITHDETLSALKIMGDKAKGKDAREAEAVLLAYVIQQSNRQPSGEVRWLVYSREHNLWWRSNRAGYTPVIEEAGRYSREEAERICKQAGVGRGGRDAGDEGPPEFCVPDPLCVVEPSPGITLGREDEQRLRAQIRSLRAKLSSLVHARDNVPAGYDPVEAWSNGEEVVVLGDPPDEEKHPDAHNCDCMGCGAFGPHVIARARLLKDSPHA